MKDKQNHQVAQKQIDVIRMMGYNQSKTGVLHTFDNRTVLVQGGGFVLDGYIQIKEAAKKWEIGKEELMNFALMVGLRELLSLEIHGLFQQTVKNL